MSMQIYVYIYSDTSDMHTLRMTLPSNLGIMSTFVMDRHYRLNDTSSHHRENVGKTLGMGPLNNQPHIYLISRGYLLGIFPF